MDSPATNGALRRLGIAVGAAVGAAFLMALAVAVVDLYLTGHGHASITRDLIAWDPGGVHMSAGDIAVLLAAGAAAALAWRLA
jgi:hypothetical protein